MASLLFAHKFKTPMAANSLLPALVTVPGTPEPEVDAAFATPSLHSTVEADAAAQRRPTTHAGEAGRNKSSVAQVTDPDDTQSTGREEKTTKSIQKPAIKNAKSASKTKQQHEVSFTPNSRQNGKKADDKPRRGELRLEDEDDDDASNAAAVAATTKRKKAAPEDQKKKTTKAKAMLAAEKQKEKKAAERARSREAKRRFINDGDDDEEDDAAVEEVEVADASDADEVDQDQALDEGGVFDLGAEDEEEEAAAAAAAITSGDDEDGDDDDAKQTDNDFDRKLMSSKRARRAPSSHGRRNGDVFQSDVLDVVNESGDDDDDDGPKSSRKSKNKSKKRARDTDGAAAERRASKSKRRSSSAAVDGDDDAEVEDTFDMNVVLQQNAARFKLTTRREGEPMTTQSVRKVVTKAPRGGAPVKINYRLIQCDTYQRCGYSKKELMQVNTSRALRVFPTNFLHFAPFNERGKYDIDDIISFFVEKNGTMTAASRKFLLQLYYLDFQKNYSAFCEFYGRVPEYIEIIRSFDFPPVPPQLYVKKERKGKGKADYPKRVALEGQAAKSIGADDDNQSVVPMTVMGGDDDDEDNDDARSAATAQRRPKSSAPTAAAAAAVAPVPAAAVPNRRALRLDDGPASFGVYTGVDLTASAFKDWQLISRNYGPGSQLPMATCLGNPLARLVTEFSTMCPTEAHAAYFAHVVRSQFDQLAAIVDSALLQVQHPSSAAASAAQDSARVAINVDN